MIRVPGVTPRSLFWGRGDVENAGTGRVSNAIHLGITRKGDCQCIRRSKGSGVRWSARHGGRRPVSRGIPIAAGRVRIPSGTPGLSEVSR